MKRFLYNQPVLRNRRRWLRHNQTEAEKILWTHLGPRQADRPRFFRQYSIGPYILDFYSPRLRLAIELDGSSHDHDDAKIYDDERTRYLESLDIREVRFRNEEVINDAETAVAKILSHAPLK